MTSPEEQEPQIIPSSTERIRELLAIDQDIVQSLNAASDAIRVLQGKPSAENEDSQSVPTIETTQQEFEAKNAAFLDQLQSISARLHRHAYALTEAGIIPDEAQAQARISSAQVGQRGDALPMPITNGGFGNFDIGWLNSRRDDVSKQKEAELWKEARELAETLGHDRKAKGPKDINDGDAMNIDESGQAA